MEAPIVYIPMDRRLALAQGQELPDRAHGAVLFADVAGFTPLTEALARQLGPRRGAEELVETLNLVYGKWVEEVHRLRGSVIAFSGDAITCWFDADEGRRAVACALALQRAMDQLAELRTRSGVAVTVAIKVGVAAGPVRRFLVGDPRVQLIDVLAGATLERAAAGEKLAQKGEVVAAAEVVSGFGDDAEISEWREGSRAGQAGLQGSFALVARLAGPLDAAPWPALPSAAGDAVGAPLSADAVRTWLLPPVYERLQAEQGLFLAELRPAAPLFLQFAGLDYDHDDAAGEKLDAYVRWVQGVLARYESYLLQLTCGDKGSYLYAAFGAPVAHDDDPARAVAAALELRTLPPEMEFISSVRSGISRGRMWAGAYGGPARRTYGVIGDEVNVAARLMEEAAPGEILVSQRIAAAAGRSHSFEFLRNVELKGKGEPLPVYAPAARPSPSPQRPATLYSSPLVGREEELARMEGALTAVLAGRGGILRLQGEAGIGKSRLAAEFVERAAGRGVRVALGTCHSTRQGIAYTPWRQVFRVLLGLTEGSPGAAADEAAQVEAALRQTNPQWLLRLPLLGDLLDLPIPDNETTAAFSPQVRQESLFSLAIALVQAWSAAQPLLLLVEDTHWMDEASLALTVALGRALGRFPVLLALVHRPVLPQERLLWPELERLPQHQPVLLEELPPQGLGVLVANRLGGSPAPLVLSLIEALAQGNPFFAEELVDTLREVGALAPAEGGSWILSEPLCRTLGEANCLTREDGQWVLAPEARLSAADLGLPDSLHGIVLSRMDRLPEPPKLTLKVASVIGRSFELNVLEAAHPAAPGQGPLLEQMEMLQARDLARLETPEPRRTYLFKHSITQEVVYQTMLEDQQRQLHRAVGEALEKLQPEAVGRLAYHYSHSGVRDKAIHYLRRAGEQAATRYANVEAVRYLSQALALLPEESRVERYEFLLAREKVLDLQGEREAQGQDLAALRVLAGALQDDRRQVEVTLRQAHNAEATGNYAEAHALALQAIDLTDRAGRAAADLSAAGYFQSGMALFRRGTYAEARVQIEEALALARTAGLVGLEADCLRLLGNVTIRQGDPARAEGYYEQALQIHRRAADLRGEGLVLNNLGVAADEQGDFARSRALYERALDRARQVGERRSECMALGNLSNVALQQGDLDAAESYAQEVLEKTREIGDRYNESRALSNLGAVTISRGDYGKAGAYLDHALHLCRETGDRRGEGIMLGNLGDVFMVQGCWDEARNCAEQALLLFRQIGDRGGEAIALNRLGRVAHAQGDYQSARELCQQAADIAHELSDPAGEALTLKNVGHALSGLGKPAEAVAVYRRTLEMGRRLDQTYVTLDCLAGLAHVTQVLGDLARALAYVDEILDFLGACPPSYDAEEPFVLGVYLTCYQVLQATRDERAGDVLRVAYDLLQERAARITDEALRRSYLENVTVHRQIVQEMARQEGRPA